MLAQKSDLSLSLSLSLSPNPSPRTPPPTYPPPKSMSFPPTLAFGASFEWEILDLFPPFPI